MKAISNDKARWDLSLSFLVHVKKFFPTKPGKLLILTPMVIFLGLAGGPVHSLAGTFAVYGPEVFQREAGSPVTITNSFNVVNPRTLCTIKIYNGGLEDGEFERVSSSVIGLNGLQVVGLNEFNQKVTLIEKPVNLAMSNELSVEVRGKPGGAITIEILCDADEPPTITASVDPQPNAAGWNKSDVTVTFTCNDTNSGIASCTGPVLVTAEGAAQIVTGTAVNNAGNNASTSVSINLDKTSPAITSSGTPPPNTNGWNNTDVTVSFDCSDTLSGIATCTDPVVVTAEGVGQVVTGTAVDLADNSANAGLTVNIDKTPPVITLVEPSIGTTTEPEQACLGSLNEAASLTLNGQPVTVEPDNSFNCGPVTLQEGINIFQFVATDPAGNTGQLIMTVTLEIAMITVPDVGNLPLAEAEEAIVGAGLTIGNLFEEYSLITPTGVVLRQLPLAGAEVEPGLPVDLLLTRQPPAGPDEMIPTAWEGQWEVTISYIDTTSNNLMAVEEVSGAICTGDPIGLSLLEAVLGNSPHVNRADCTGIASETSIDTSCSTQVNVDGCVVEGVLQFQVNITGDSLAGTGSWSVNNSCSLPLSNEGQTFVILGVRMVSDPGAGCESSASSFFQKFMKHPLLPLAEGLL